MRDLNRGARDFLAERRRVNRVRRKINDSACITEKGLASTPPRSLSLSLGDSSLDLGLCPECPSFGEGE
jgi:hypothetical protein